MTRSRSRTRPDASSPNRTGWRSWSDEFRRALAVHHRELDCRGDHSGERPLGPGSKRWQPRRDGKAWNRVDSLQIQEIEDASGYIDNIAAPHAAAIASLARIAAAKADQEAAQREQEAAALPYQYLRDTEIKQAGFAAETEQAKARAAQAGPLAEAQASQEVIAQQAHLAELQAELTAKRLESDVRRPADAEAYKTRTIAEAERDKVKAETETEAFRQTRSR